LDIPFSLDDSDSDADAKTVDDDPLKFNEWMCRWAVDNNVTHHALTSLLVGLQKKYQHPGLMVINRIGHHIKVRIRLIKL
jgi:hypothetical protein